PQESISSKAEKAGVAHSEHFDKLFDFISEAAKQRRKIHFLPPYRAMNKLLLEKLLGIHPSRQKEDASVELIKAVVKLRSIKGEYEIEELEKAAMIGYEMHTTAMKMTQPGVVEQEIAGFIEGMALSYGKGVSFPVILSVRGETLHNHNHSNVMKDGDLLIVDAGAASNMHYASDFTRTLPVSGRFTPKQKDIYEIVLAANQQAIEAIKPGVRYLDIHLLAARVIANGLKEVGLMKGDVDEAVKAGAHALFFPHGLGHMMGLDVHDMEDIGQIYVGYDDEVRPSDQFGTAYLRLGRRLQEGFVLTVEPGIYFIPALIEQWKTENKFAEFINYEKVEEYKGFGGIRIEDDVLVTASACRLIGKPVPRTVEEIEAIMKK
ncbi:MAG: M24B family metallopeptidase, partial [Bacteroidales bacterium]|nr:M24B family metallopeptidase [Bacteroidales bacterium]